MTATEALRSRPPAWVGIDPGASGAITLYPEYGNLVVVDFSDIKAMYDLLLFWSEVWDIKSVVIEEQWTRKHDGSKSATTFQQHVGMWKAVLILLELPWCEATPQKWMKRRVPAKKHPKDKPSMPYVAKHYPYISLKGPRGGDKDGRADAVCIAEYAREIETGKKVR
jgi:hypothetical protein